MQAIASAFVIIATKSDVNMLIADRCCSKQRNFRSSKVILLAAMTVLAALHDAALVGNDKTNAIDATMDALFNVASMQHSTVSREQIPQQMFRLYARKHRLKSDNRTFRTYFSQSRPGFNAITSRRGGRLKRFWSMCIFFDVSDIPSTETIHRADLYVQSVFDYVSASSSSDEYLAVYRITKPVNASVGAAHLRLINTYVIDNVNTTTSEIVMPLTSVVTSWRRRPKSNHGLVLRWARHVSRDTRHVTRDSRRQHKRSLLKGPYLMTYGEQAMTSLYEQEQTNDVGRKHKKRSANRRLKSPGGASLCRRRPLYVDFADIGWQSWIIAPSGYEAFYCAGECPFYLPDTVNPTNHAIIQAKVHSVGVNFVPKPCCVPTKLSPISILQTNSKNNAVILKNYAGMVVEECGCR